MIFSCKDKSNTNNKKINLLKLRSHLNKVKTS